MTVVATTTPTKHLFVYVFPTLHLVACATSMIGHAFPNLQYLGIVWVGVMLADLPVSSIAYVLAWKHGAIAAIWIVIVGTLWWCLLGFGADLLVAKYKLNR